MYIKVLIILILGLVFNEWYLVKNVYIIFFFNIGWYVKLGGES